MFYIWTLDAHELHGTFETHAEAHAYAKVRGFGSYMIEPAATVGPWQLNSFRPAFPVTR